MQTRKERRWNATGEDPSTAFVVVLLLVSHTFLEVQLAVLLIVFLHLKYPLERNGTDHFGEVTVFVAPRHEVVSLVRK
jgi:heme/copper-type cytochrome/quinol oxidase subunit 4